MEIDWDDLLDCFLDLESVEEHYFDRDSGHIISLGENEDEDEGMQELRELLDDEPDRFVDVVPIDESDRLECLENFIAELKERQLRDLASRLHQLSRNPDALSATDRLLADFPEERQRWRQLQEKRAHEAIAAWIEENDIEADNTPPWKTKLHRKRPK
jgi:hypothetical protein